MDYNLDTSFISQWLNIIENEGLFQTDRISVILSRIPTLLVWIANQMVHIIRKIVQFKQDLELILNIKLIWLSISNISATPVTMTSYHKLHQMLLWRVNWKRSEDSPLLICTSNQFWPSEQKYSISITQIWFCLSLLVKDNYSSAGVTMMKSSEMIDCRNVIVWLNTLSRSCVFLVESRGRGWEVLNCVPSY